MSRSCTAEELDGLFGSGVFVESGEQQSVSIFSPCARRYLVFQDLIVPLGEKSRMVLGSDPASCDMVLVGSRVGKQHALIQYYDGCYFIEDLGSAHGTYVNGKRISSMMELRPGDEIMLRPYRIRFSGGASTSY